MGEITLTAAQSLPLDKLGASDANGYEVTDPERVYA